MAAPRTTPSQLILLPGWRGGINRDADPAQLPIEDSPDALNVNFGLAGAVSKRKGYALWDASPASTPRRLYRWKVLGGTERLFCVEADGNLLYGSSAPLTDLAAGVGAVSGDAEYHVGVASLENKLYFTALGATTPYSYDGTSWAAETATVFDGTANRFPVAAHLATHHERIFAANVLNGSTRYASRLYWSDALLAETWSASNYIDFDPDDGQEITGLQPFGENLVIFKNHGVQLLTGRSEASFSRYNLEQELGTESPRAIVSYSGRLFFFDAFTGVWSFDGAGFQPEDEKINSYLLDGQNFTYRHKAIAFIYRKRLYLSVPWGAATDPSRTFVKDLRTGAWSEYDYGFTAATLFADEPYVGGIDGDSALYEIETGLTDAGTAIAAHFKTAWLEPIGTPSTRHRLRRLDTVWSAIGDIDVTARMYRDYSLSPLLAQALDTDPGGSVWGTMVWGDPWGAGQDEVLSRTTGWGGNRWRALQFEFRTTGATDDWQLNRMALSLSSLNRTRGEA